MPASADFPSLFQEAHAPPVAFGMCWRGSPPLPNAAPRDAICLFPCDRMQAPITIHLSLQEAELVVSLGGQKEYNEVPWREDNV